MRALLAAALALLAAASTGAEGETRLRPGVFLYAAPDLRSPPFDETVVLLVRHEEEGSLGLIVNRPTRVPLREALSAPTALARLDLPLYFGGPVMPDAVLGLVRSPRPVTGATRVLADVHFCAELAPLERAARGPDPASRLRVYAGYTGWGAGQLAGELRQGAWVVGPADARSVFTSEPESVWPRVHDLLRRLEVRR